MRKFVTANANGRAPMNANEVIISIYGPRNGLRAIEALTPKEARLLGHDLIAAACAIELEEEKS